jgi:hypothetical protein
MRLGKRYGAERLAAASARAFAAGARSYKNVKAILERGLDRAPLDAEKAKPDRAPVAHENIRGPKHYH